MPAKMPGLPVKQWAQVMQDFGSGVGLHEMGVPSPMPDEVLVNIKYSGGCHSYLHQWDDHNISPLRSTVDGHEGVGVVTAIGKNVKDIKIGDHVGVQWLNRTCGECESCKVGDYLYCPDVKLTGVSAGGTQGEYCTCQEAHAIRIPKHYPLESVVHILCAGLIAYKAVKDLGLTSGRTVAISDAHTGLGTLACQYAKACGLHVVALADGRASRHDMKHYTDHIIDYASTEDIVDSVHYVTGGSPDGAIILASGGTTLQSGIEFVKTSGTVVLVGLRPGGSMEADFSRALSRMVNIKSSFGGSKDDTQDAMKIFVEKQFQTAAELLNLEKMYTALQSMKQGELVGKTTIKIPERREENQIVSNGAMQLPGDFSFPIESDYNVGTYLAHRMEELGTKDFFAVPGDTNLSLLDNLLKSPNLRMVSCCNELNTGYAADGFARTSRSKIAFVVIPYIVGGLSILNAISGAHSAHLKVVVISGCPNTNMLTDDKFLHHTPSQTNKNQALRAFEGVTAASVRVDSPETATSVIDGALLECLNKSLPVYIEVANDMSTAPCEAPSPLLGNIDFGLQQSQTKKAIESFKRIWNAAKKPILLIGPLAHQVSSKDDVELLAEKLGCAVCCQPDSRLIPESHPQSCGVFWPGVLDNAEGEQIVMGADLWVVLGGSWSDLHALGIDTKNERYRMIDIQYEGICFPDGNTLGPVDLRSLVSGLIMSDITSNATSIPKSHVQLSSPDPRELQLSEKPLTIGSLMAGIQSFLRGHHTIIADTGETWFVANGLRLPQGADCHMQVAYASIGWSVGAGLGAQIGLPDRRVIILAGDGSFQMTAQELSTMIRMRLNPIIVLFNNLGYKTESAIHEGPYNYIANWDYVKFAKSLSGEPHAESHNPYAREESTRKKDLSMFAAKIETQADLALALQRAEAESGKLAFLECCIQPGDVTTELRRLGEKVGSGVATSDSNAETPASTPSIGDSGKTPSSPSSTDPQHKLYSHGRDLDASRLKVNRTKTPRTVPPPDSPDVLSHKVCTDHMVLARWSLDGGWDDPEIVPYGALDVIPSASALHYSTMCFEGMKAYRGKDGKLRLFRADLNCCRLLDSAARVCLPRFNTRDLHTLIKKICEIDAPKWLPANQRGSSLYIRPTFIGTSEGLGLDVPKEALLFIIVSFWANPTVSASSSPTPKKGLRLWASPKHMTRSWPGGYGSAKLSSNYGPSLLAQRQAQAAGYDQVLWLFGHDRQVTEAGASNLFFIWRSHQGALQGHLQLITAPLDDNLILPGVTRRSILELARERLSTADPASEFHSTAEPLEVVEKRFTIHDVIAAADQGRLRGAFVSGTACFITPVTSIHFEGREIEIEADATPHTSLFRKWVSDIVNGEEEHPWTEVVEG